MTDDDKKLLATRLRNFAKEYAKITSRARGVEQMVADLRAAADELDPPA